MAMDEQWLQFTTKSGLQFMDRGRVTVIGLGVIGLGVIGAGLRLKLGS